jgi:hypothetical protein
MHEQLELCLLQAQQAPPNSADRDLAIVQLAQQILKGRQVARPLRGQLTGIYLEIVEQARFQLQRLLEQRVDSYNYHRVLPRQWAEAIRQEVFESVLSRFCLQRLALMVQQQQPKTELYQYAICELIQAIRCSGKLARTQLSQDIYQDAVNQTLLWVCQNIQSYDPKRGEFMAWVNYRLERIGYVTQQTQRDPYTRATQGKVIRTKYQLNAMLQQLKSLDLLGWLGWYVRRLLPASGFPVLVVLVTLSSLAALIQQAPALKDTVLFNLAQELLDLPPPLVYSEDLTFLEIPQIEEVSLADTLRDYIEDDPDRLFQKHIQGRPEATFQAIALARLEGETWESLAHRYDVKIPTLSNHFRRSLTSLAPKIRAAIQQ